MRYHIFSLLSLLITINIQAQIKDSTKWLRAFPITDYIVDGGDSTKIVQLEMPENITIKEKTTGVAYGVYKTRIEEAVEKGVGRCYLIKGNYYYFAINNNKSGLDIQGGDIIYTLIPKTNIYYGYIPKLASHFIRLMDVYDSAFYDRYKVFSNWTAATESATINHMVEDIQFTGSYFRENNPGMDTKIKTGEYKNQSTFEIMVNCTPQLLSDFLVYMNVKPRLYAGREWKISEIFATWLSEGAPKVIGE